MILIHKDCGGTISEHHVSTFPPMVVRLCDKCDAVDRVPEQTQTIELAVAASTLATAATASYLPFNDAMNILDDDSFDEHGNCITRNYRSLVD